MLQTHNTALSCLEGLAVLAVHCTETEESQLRLRADNAGLASGTEYLCKVHLLALVHDIEHLVRMVQLLALNQRGKIRRRVQGSAI